MSRLGSLYIKLGSPDGEMPGCCETADWAAGYIEELQTELNEQARLLGMSAERELKMIAERDRFRDGMRDKINELHAEIERLRAERDRFMDGMLTLGTELRAVEAALDDKRINMTHTAAQVAAEMRDKINELHAQIQRLTNERNALGLAIDRAISGIVPDEHPLRSRLVEIAALRAEIEAMKRAMENNDATHQ